MTTYPSTCAHGDASMAYPLVKCGEVQDWYCETRGGCGQTFARTREHDAILTTHHAADCTATAVQREFGACECPPVPVLACVNCDAEFAPDTDRDDVLVFA